MPTYRCTRKVLYPPNTPGYNDPTQRQGYYLELPSKDAAYLNMEIKFPKEKHIGFDVEFWK